MESLGTSVGLFLLGSWFSSWFVFSIDTGHVAQSSQSRPRWSSAFKMEPVLPVSSFTFSSSTFFRFPYSPSIVSSSIYCIHSPLKDIYFLAGLGHSCGMCRSFSRTRDLVPWPGIRPGLLYWKCRVLATGPPGKSPVLLFLVMTGITILREFLPFKPQRVGSVFSK